MCEPDYLAIGGDESLSYEANLNGRKILTPAQIPQYLRSSDFASSLNFDDEEEFFVPAEVTKQTDDAGSVKDLKHLLATVRFWGLQQFPVTVLDFAFAHHIEEFRNAIHQFLQELPDLATIAASAASTTDGGSITIAMENGCMQFFKYLLDRGHALTDDGVKRAIENGHAECVQFALSVDRRLENTAFTTAAQCKNTSSIKAILSALAGRLNFQIPTDIRTYSVCDVAACVGDIAYIANARGQGWWWGPLTVEAAATSGQLDCLKYLLERGCPLCLNLVDSAAEYHQFDCVAFLLCNGIYSLQINQKTMSAVVAAGELRCLSLLSLAVHAQHHYREDYCVLAAQHGHLECLIFLHEHGYRWGATVTSAAAETGHYDCLWYAVQQGCPVARNVCTVLADRGGEQLLMQFACMNIARWFWTIAACAAERGYLSCLVYLVEHGLDERAGPWLCEVAAGAGKVLCLQYLHEQGFHWNCKATFAALKANRCTCLAYLLERWCAADTRTCEGLAARGELRLLRIALAGSKRISILGVMIAAAEHGQLACLQYLCQKYDFRCWGSAIIIAAVNRRQWACAKYLLGRGYACDQDIDVYLGSLEC